MQSLALTVQESLKLDSHAGDLYIFRGRRRDLVKIHWHDGLGMSLTLSALTMGSSSGPRRRPARYRSQRRRWPICARSSTD
ncbi:transposase [Bradyrhizobium sp. Rc2d]|uniref:transposase n=1 Tax=Bradyrhizobium sp. Rc2d TaxID=1855321 RepID=UPI001FCE0E14|nr:transposase [Bradyrhizobium sp. Rc2d]